MDQNQQNQQTQFINTFVNNAVATIHEYLAINLQLKTQLNILEQIVKGKDEQIAKLQEQNNELLTLPDTVNTSQNEAAHWKRLYEEGASKLSHMDTLLAQMKDMKNQILIRDEIIARNEQALKELEKELEGKSQDQNKKKRKLEVLPTLEKTDDNTF